MDCVAMAHRNDEDGCPVTDSGRDHPMCLPSLSRLAISLRNPVISNSVEV
jgi:hypothetical protein